eukprot:TRINITY_DN1163_c0_g1_i1.p1 TRINITY_DN1163_c0_g1~~TRINITY_DN1163_c0_g1_i1.p1  ORF type:complete len:565 (-),score=92.21 TRINITY_DN1163_c0_g1_i1:1777-3471(-)
MSELVLNIFLLNDAPIHTISAVFITSDFTTLVTADKNGLICFWNLTLDKKESCLSPRFIAVSNNNLEITALTECNYKSRESIVSSGVDGTISIWSTIDGLCLASSSNLFSTTPTILLTLTNRSRIAVASLSNEIAILDVESLSVVSSFRVNTDWVTSLFAFDLGTTPLLISGCKDGTMRYWSLNETDGLPVFTFILPSSIQEPLSVSMAPDLITFMVVSHQSVSVFLASSTHLLFTVLCPYECGWKCGAYIESKRILVWSENGITCLYKIKLPKTEIKPLSFPMKSPSPRAIHKHEEMPSLTEIEKIRYGNNNTNNTNNHCNSSNGSNGKSNTSQPIVTPPHKRFLEENPDLDIPKMEVVDLDANTQPPSIMCILNQQYVHSKNPKTGCCWGNIFAMGGSFGKVEIWVFPDSEKSYSSSSFAMSSLCEYWKKNIHQGDANYGKVTSSLLVEDSLFLVRGFDTGYLMSSILPSQSNPIIVKAHKAKINTLICSSSVFHKRVISGSDDFSISIWSLPNLDLVHRFSNHGGPVTSLFFAPVGKLDEIFGNQTCSFPFPKIKLLGCSP